MPAKDIYHDTVINALEKQGWAIIDENVTIAIGNRWVLIDIEARNANRTVSILVEVKTFGRSQSALEQLANALGKYLLYKISLNDQEITAPLYLAIPISAYNGIFSDTIGRLAVQNYQLRLIVFDPETEEILQWLD